MEKLAIRLGSTLSEPIHWLVWSDAEKEIIASGELPNADALAQLKERAPNASVVGIIPSSDVVLKTVQLPAKANRKVLNAIPYMLEDELSTDIQKAFFAFGQRIGDKQQVAIVSREKMTAWTEALKKADLFCDIFVPDVLALPYAEDTVSLLSLGNDTKAPVLVRFNEWEGFQGEHIWSFPILEKHLLIAPKPIVAFSELPNAEYLDTLFARLKDSVASSTSKSPSNEHDVDTEVAKNQTLNNSLQITANYDKLPMHLLLDGALSAKFNLLQGEFAVKRKSTAQWDKWRLAAVLAAVALCVNLVSKTVELSSLKEQRQALESRLQSTISSGFPNLPKSRDKRAAIKREMARLEQGGGGISMLVMLTQMSPSFASTGVSPQSIRYDASRTELRMQSVASNFESLEKFRREVQSLGFEVDQGAINNKGDQVVGTIIIKG